MKRIDKNSQKKLYWSFLPMAIIVVLEILYICFDYDLLNRWLGIGVNPLEWISPALMWSLILVGGAFSVVAIRQKCWGELVIGLTVIIISLLNMSNFFVNIL